MKPAFSQDSTFHIRLKQVEITAQRPLKEKGLIITKIDSTALLQNMHNSMSDLLSTSSPVFIKSYGESGLASASFRGTAASHTKVDWNGIALNSPMLGQADFSLIPVFFADEVNLFHGGSSLGNGSGALGGSISIKSKTNLKENNGAYIIQNYGSFNTSQTFAKLGFGNSQIRGIIRIFKTISDNDFLFYNTANGEWNYQRQQNANYEKQGILGDLYFNSGNKNLLSAHFWHQTADRNLPAIMSYQGEGRNENQFDKETRIAGKWQYYNKNFHSDYISGISISHLTYFLANNTPGGYLLNYHSESNTLGLYNNYVAEYSFNSKTIIKASANLNYYKAEFIDKKLETGYSATRTEAGSGISLHREIKQWFSTFLLLRLEISNGKNLPLMPSTGLEFVPFKQKDFVIKTSFTRNYHQPTLNDLFWIPGGNPNLKPEKGYTGDLSLWYGLNIAKNIIVKPEITAYYSKISDWIVWRPGDYRFWQAENIQTVCARGFETKLSTKINKPGIKYSMSAGYNYTRTTNQENENIEANYNKQLIYIPIHSANSTIKLSLKKNFLIYGFSYTGERFTTSSNETERHSLPGYSLHNILIGRNIKIMQLPVEFQFRVNNLFNTSYQAILWRAMPGRNYLLTLKVSFEKKTKTDNFSENIESKK
ncbi:MAG: TonB-dependent receptor plug domain-containing protein [Bacteroidales bacterium]|nr:TonB-dependent receptor plug domain-containing protein [Bacteroidales bacterium]